MQSSRPQAPALPDLIDAPTLQSLQDGFARLANMPTSILDPEGVPLTTPSADPAFCDYVRATPIGKIACDASHAEAACHALTGCDGNQRTCHAGLTLFAAPIRLGEARLGAVVVGGRPVEPLESGFLEKLAATLNLTGNDLQPLARELPLWMVKDTEQASAFASQLALTVGQLAEHADQLRRRTTELSAIHSLAAMLAGRTSLQEVMDLSCRALVDVMSLRAAAIRLLDEETGDLRIVSVASMSQRYLTKGPLSVDNSPVDAAALLGETVYVEDICTDPRTVYKQEAKEEGLVSGLAAPLRCRGRAIGVLRAYTDRPHRFTDFERRLMEAMAAQIAAAILNARLQSDVRQAEHLDRQIKLAADVQRRMLPAEAPRHPRLEFGCLYEPSAELAGDFYDFFELSGERIGLVIADVVGKGIPASLMMAGTRAALRSRAGADDLVEVMTELNLRTCRDCLPSEFVTAFYGVIDMDDSCLTYCCAGHEPPILLRGKQVHVLATGGTVLGIDEFAQYRESEQKLKTGDVLVFYTDGLIDALDYDDNTYGRDRLRESLIRHGKLPALQLAKQLLWDVRRFAGLSSLPDDITLVTLRILSGK